MVLRFLFVPSTLQNFFSFPIKYFVTTFSVFLTISSYVRMQ